MSVSSKCSHTWNKSYSGLCSVSCQNFCKGYLWRNPSKGKSPKWRNGESDCRNKNQNCFIKRCLGDFGCVGFTKDQKGILPAVSGRMSCKTNTNGETVSPLLKGKMGQDCQTSMELWNPHQAKCPNSRYSIEPIDDTADLHPQIPYLFFGISPDSENTGENHKSSVTGNGNFCRRRLKSPGIHA